MKTMKAMTAAVSLIAVAACAAPPPKPAVREDLVQKTATVIAVDQASRLVTLRAEDGSAVTVKVSDEVKNLPQVREGDKVTVSYYQALAAEVKKPGEGVQGVQTDVAAATAQPGSMPAAGAGVVMRTTVVIDSVDTKLNTVTFTRSDGAQRTVAVESPEGRTFIKGLKKGDHVEVAYTEAFAIEVKPAG
jgi:Cu/Ag efflux protein CusF